LRDPEIQQRKRRPIAEEEKVTDKSVEQEMANSRRADR